MFLAFKIILNMNNSEIDTELENIITCRSYNTGYPIAISSWLSGTASYQLQQPIGVDNVTERVYTGTGGISYSNNMLNQLKILAVNNVTNSATSPTINFSILDSPDTTVYKNIAYEKRMTATDTPRLHSPQTLPPRIFC